jgi:hypothetical protein
MYVCSSAVRQFGTQAHLAGRVGQRIPHGTAYADAGQTMADHEPDVPIEAFSADSADLDRIVLFMMDATKSFSTPARLD